MLSYTDISKRQEFNLGGALAMGGAVAGGYEGAYYFAAGATALSDPAVPALIFLSSTLSGASIVTGSPPADQPKPVSNAPTSYDSYKAAVYAQQSQGNYPDATPRFAPVGSINQAIASFKPQMFTDNKDPSDDDTFANFGVHVSGQVVVDKIQENWQADSYGSNGFQGIQPGTFNRTGTPYFRIKFAYTGSTPMPAPTTPGTPGA